MHCLSMLSCMGTTRGFPEIRSRQRCGGVRTSCCVWMCRALLQCGASYRTPSPSSWCGKTTRKIVGQTASTQRGIPSNIFDPLTCEEFVAIENICCHWAIAWLLSGSSLCFNHWYQLVDWFHLGSVHSLGRVETGHIFCSLRHGRFGRSGMHYTVLNCKSLLSRTDGSTLVHTGRGERERASSEADGSEN